MVMTKQQIPMEMLLVFDNGRRENPTLVTKALGPMLTRTGQRGLDLTARVQDGKHESVKQTACSVLMEIV